MTFQKNRKYIAAFLVCTFLSSFFQTFAESHIEIQKNSIDRVEKNKQEIPQVKSTEQELPYIEGDVFVKYKTNLRTRSTPERSLQGI